MIQTMRWYGPKDPVTLMDLRQAGCQGVVTALHQIAVGAEWSKEEIRERKGLIEIDNGRFSPLHWQVVESLPVHEDIKKGLPSREKYLEHYRRSLQNLAECGITTVCYNFMPVLDWSRTDVHYEMPDGSKALRFVWQDFALFDLFILKRPNAGENYSEDVQNAAWKRFQAMRPEEMETLKNTILLGLPGSDEAFELASFQLLLDQYQKIGPAELKENLFYFIQQVGPTAREYGVNLCIHPDDPPRPLLGLPRVVSTATDLAELMAAYDHPVNGITFCTGSLGVRPDNDLPAMAQHFADRVHFIHLRSTKREANLLDFHEADHLTGDVDMYAIVEAFAAEEKRRKMLGMPNSQIPMRPDHGHQMLDDLNKSTYPGYSAIGRLRGLAELRGLEAAIVRAMGVNRV